MVWTLYVVQGCRVVFCCVWFNMSTVAGEHHSSGERTCAGFDGPESSSRGRGWKRWCLWGEKVSYNPASAICDAAVVNVLKRRQTTSDDPLNCPDHALELVLLLWGGGSKPDGCRWSAHGLDDRCGGLQHWRRNTEDGHQHRFHHTVYKHRTLHSKVFPNLEHPEAMQNRTLKAKWQVFKNQRLSVIDKLVSVCTRK